MSSLYINTVKASKPRLNFLLPWQVFFFFFATGAESLIPNSEGMYCIESLSCLLSVSPSGWQHQLSVKVNLSHPFCDTQHFYICTILDSNPE